MTVVKRYNWVLSEGFADKVDVLEKEEVKEICEREKQHTRCF